MYLFNFNVVNLIEILEIFVLGIILFGILKPCSIFIIVIRFGSFCWEWMGGFGGCWML
jgi:hypothetical protein